MILNGFTPNRFIKLKTTTTPQEITFFMKTVFHSGTMPARAVAKPTLMVEKAMMRVAQTRKPTS